MTPYIVKDKMTNSTQAVPCGKCPACVKRRVSAWSFRLMQEEKNSSSSIFLTLTYDTNHLSFSSNGLSTIRKDDLQKFFKRFRKACVQAGGTDKVKYYAVGEYGGKTSRPHYHVILFNGDISKIQPAWAHGECHYGTVSGASIGYTLKYISKKRTVPAFSGDDRQQEFSLMSKGLGARYINEKTKCWHHASLQNRMYCTMEDGKKVSMPRYYKQKLYEKEQRKAVGAEARLKKLKSDEALERQLQSDGSYAEFQQATVEAVKSAFHRMEQQSVKLDKL